MSVNLFLEAVKTFSLCGLEGCMYTPPGHLLATGQLTEAFHPYYVSQWDRHLGASYSTLSKQFSNLFKGEIVVPSAQV